MIAIKKRLSLLCVVSLIIGMAFADTNKSCKKNICADTVKAKTICADELIVKTGCCACRTITAKDFMDADGNLSQTFVITEPGKYSLGQNIAFAPVDQDACAIQILANDVHLDLCGNTLTQGNDTFEVFAVQIGEGFFYNNPDNVLKNITVTNGSITKFTGSGIFCYNASFDGGAGELAFESLIFTDLQILDCGTHPSFVISGIYLESFASQNLYDPATRVAYKNVIIENCNVNRCLGNGSIYIFTGDNIIVNNTQANETVTEISVFGITFGYNIVARNLQMYNSQGNGIRDMQEEQTRSLVSAINLTDSINVHINQCQFNDTFGFADLAVYSDFANVSNMVIENTQFNNSRGGPLAGILSGIRIGLARLLQETQANGLKFINCQFNGTTVDANAPVSNPAYFSINCGVLFQTVQNVVFENCQACNIHTDNPNYSSFGYFVAADFENGVPPFLNVQNITFKGSTASDISTAGKHAVGFFTGALNASLSREQGQLINVVVKDCISERIRSSSDRHIVAGIADGLYQAEGSSAELFYSAINNLLVSNCSIADIRSTSTVMVSPLSAGIVAESVHRPNITGNSVSDCDRGILLTGTNQIIPNGFQVAASLEDALAFPPVSIPLNVPLKLFTSPAIAGSPFDAFYTINGPRLSAPISAQGEIADPSNACSTVTNDLTGKIGIVIRDGACGSGTFVLNTEAAGTPIATTLIIDNTGNPGNFGGSPLQTQVAVAISQDDGDVLLTALEVNPTLTLIIDTIPSVSDPLQTFFNLARGNSVDVTPDQVDSQHNLIFSAEDLTEFDWQVGDPIFYDCNGGSAIPDLVCSTTYYAIVYRPGFAENGVIMNNSVDNCTVSGYEDVKPTTSSAWVNNFAFNSGSPASQDTNYDIAWSGTAPVYAGDLADYPTGSAKAYNISLIS